MKSLLAAVSAVAFIASMSVGFSQTQGVQSFAAASAQTSNLVKLNFCSGAEGGNYQFSAVEVQSQLKGVLEVHVFATKGSMENLDRIVSKDCDVAIVQNDAFKVYLKDHVGAKLSLERAATLYKEYVHLVCNRSAKVSRVVDLNDKTTVAIGPIGSGSAVTWESFKLADPKLYGKVPTVPYAGTRAVAKVADGTDASCMVFTSGLNSELVSKEISSYGNLVHLIPADDGDFGNWKDEKGQPIYDYFTIPGGTYPKLQDGMFTSSVDTVAVNAVVVVRSDWIDANDAAYNRFLKGLNAALPAIKKKVGQ